MNPDQLWETSMDPAKRKLHRITIGDAEEASKSIDVCMGSNVSIRKDFIFDNAVFSA